MKVWVDVSQEIDTEVSIAEMMSIIAELATGDQPHMILDCVNSVHRTLASITDESIAKMTDKQRDIICSALRAQADRFSK